MEYEKEGIPWDYKEYAEISNVPTLQLIEGHPISILSLLDEECIMPQGTDLSFTTKVAERLQSHPRFVAPKAAHEIMTVRHYAADVEYYTVGFLDHNRDSLLPGVSFLISKSMDPGIRQLFAQATAQNRWGTTPAPPS